MYVDRLRVDPCRTLLTCPPTRPRRLDHVSSSPAPKQYEPLTIFDIARNILMYGLVVLEDLTTWEGLPRLFDNREVTALQVRGWHVRHSVCCYGISGDRRRGYTKRKEEDENGTREEIEG